MHYCFIFIVNNSKTTKNWLTCPLSSSWLFVSFNLSKEIGCFIQWAPFAGLSGCTWILGGDTGSARPATTQALLWNAYRYLLSSHGTKSITIRYSVLGSKPNSRHCRSPKCSSFLIRTFFHFARNILNHVDKLAIDVTIFYIKKMSKNETFSHFSIFPLSFICISPWFDFKKIFRYYWHKLEENNNSLWKISLENVK